MWIRRSQPGCRHSAATAFSAIFAKRACWHANYDAPPHAIPGPVECPWPPQASVAPKAMLSKRKALAVCALPRRPAPSALPATEPPVPPGRRCLATAAPPPATARNPPAAPPPDLHAAAATNDVQQLRRLLSGRALRQLDAPGGPAGRTPLAAAAAAGHGEAVVLLLSAGADAAAADAGTREAALHVAAARQDERIVQLLVNGGAAPEARDAGGRTPAHAAAAAVCGASAGALLCLARCAPHLLGSPDSRGDTPLHLLSALPPRRCLPALSALAAGGLLNREALSLQNAQGLTAGMLARAAGSAEVERLLLSAAGCIASGGSRCRRAGRSHAADGPTVLSQAPAATQESPLLAAVERGQQGVLQSLLQGPAGERRQLRKPAGCVPIPLPLPSHALALPLAALDPNCPGDAAASERLLRAALQPGRVPLLRLLLGLPPQAAAGCRARTMALDAAALAQRLGRNPAHHALCHSSAEALACLLAAGCPPGAVLPGTAQPLLVAAAGRLDAGRCRVLLQAGARAGDTDVHGHSALDVVLALCTDAELVGPGDGKHGLASMGWRACADKHGLRIAPPSSHSHWHLCLAPPRADPTDSGRDAGWRRRLRASAAAAG